MTSALDIVEQTERQSTYTGQERRWMTRSLYDWTSRLEHHNNVWAIREAREVAILDKLHSRACARGRLEEAVALWSGMYEIKEKLNRHRESVAKDCAPWFDGSAFR